MTGTDTAMTIEDGSVESALTGGKHAHLSKANQAEMKRRALQAAPKKSKLFDTVSFEALIRGMGHESLHGPYVWLQLNDLRNGDVNPNGFSVLVNNTAQDMSRLGWRDFLMVADNSNEAVVTPVESRLDAA